MDGIFGQRQFLETRSPGSGPQRHTVTAKRGAECRITILHGPGQAVHLEYSPMREAYSDEYLKRTIWARDGEWSAYQLTILPSPGPAARNMMYEWKGFPAPAGLALLRETNGGSDEEGRIWYRSS